MHTSNHGVALLSGIPPASVMRVYSAGGIIMKLNFSFLFFFFNDRDQYSLRGGHT